MNERSRFKLKTAVVALSLVVSGVMAGQVPQPSAQFPDIPKNLKAYFIALYVKGAKADAPQTPEERTEFFRQHTAYLRSQVEAGKYLLVGPFMDGGQIRGMAVINAASADEARAIAEADPGVKSGRMAIEIHPGVLPDVGCVHVEYQSRAGK
ncbi:MAG TPA: YciI family protein [Bryobacteraceae bacterium]|nr:YciI family protein [Bryobacteraceae bacterium]